MVWSIVNFLLFQVGWFLGVLLAAAGHPIAAAAAVIGVVAVHVLVVRDRATEMRVLLPAIPFGFAVDSILAASGAVAYEGQYASSFCPPWIVAMWVLFAATLRHSSRWLLGRPIVAFLAGAVFAPLTYAAVDRFDAATLCEPISRAIVIIGIVWGVALAISAIYVARIPSPSSLATLAEG